MNRVQLAHPHLACEQEPVTQLDVNGGQGRRHSETANHGSRIERHKEVDQGWKAPEAMTVAGGRARFVRRHAYMGDGTRWGLR